MANSYFNIITFLLTTALYYISLKPPLTYETHSDPAKNTEHVSKNYMYLAIYFLLIVIVQFAVNTSIISSTCGGNITENVGAAGVFTVLPWTLIFGVLMIVLTIYPSFKSAFSDVVGYYWVSSSANQIINELLISPDIQKKINGDQVARPEQKQALQSAADAIIKICGNNSILINQIVPSNFDSYWKILNPLMKEKYQTDSPETAEIKNKFFELVVSRDNVGEALWFIYTGLLLTSIVQLKITSKGCVNNPKVMEQNYQKFLDDEKEAQQKKQQATSTTYTITN